MQEKKVVFLLEENGRTLTQKSMSALLDNIFNYLGMPDVEATIASGPSVNDPVYLADQLNRPLDEWELVYMHTSIPRPTVLLDEKGKKLLVERLKTFVGISSQAVYGVLLELNAYNQS